ncbi:MAG: hypothetical protein ACRDJ4_03700 [Actinomycetota bacterium]
MDRREVKGLNALRHGISRRLRTYRVGTEPVDIWKLASPLRYDVVVRAEYISFLREHLDLFESDLDAYLLASEALPYFIWFRDVASRFQRGYDRNDEASLRAAFAERVHRTTELFRRFQAEGFNPRYPVDLRAGTPGAATLTGKRLADRLYPGDGCHRLALVLSTGQSLLPPEWYRIRNDPLDTPLDNTHLLVRALELSREQYSEFISRGYADKVFADPGQLAAHVARTDPSRAAEVEQVLALDASIWDAAPERGGRAP